MTTAVSRIRLGDLLDRLLDAGVVLTGDVVLALADIDLVHLELRALLTGVESARRRAGIAPESMRDRSPQRDVAATPDVPALPGRVDVADDRDERGIAGLVLLLVELLRQLMEGQAIARMESGSLSDAETERLGRALQQLDRRINALREWLRTNRSPSLEGELVACRP